MKKQVNKKVIISSVAAGVGTIGAISSASALSNGNNSSSNQNIERTLKTKTVDQNNIKFKINETVDTTTIDFYFNKEQNFTYQAIFYISEFNSLAIENEDYFVNNKTDCISYTFNKSSSKKTYYVKILEINNETRQSKIVFNFDNKEVFVVNPKSSQVFNFSNSIIENGKLSFSITPLVIQKIEERLSNMFTEGLIEIKSSLKFNIGDSQNENHFIYKAFNDIISPTIRIDYNTWQKYFKKFSFDLTKVNGTDAFTAKLNIILNPNYSFADGTTSFSGDVVGSKNVMPPPTEPGEDVEDANQQNSIINNALALRQIRGTTLMTVVGVSASIIVAIAITIAFNYNRLQKKKLLLQQKQRNRFIREENKNISEIKSTFEAIKNKKDDKK